jgi:hypothetical protein
VTASPEPAPAPIPEPLTEPGARDWGDEPDGPTDHHYC